MARPALAQRAAQMRAHPTPAEAALHQALVDRGVPHRRQVCISGYIADFAFHGKLLVELDGYHHFTTAGRRRDAIRTAALKGKGYFVLRFPNSMVFSDPEKVCLLIIAYSTRRRRRR